MSIGPKNLVKIFCCCKDYKIAQRCTVLTLDRKSYQQPAASPGTLADTELFIICAYPRPFFWCTHLILVLLFTMLYNSNSWRIVVDLFAIFPTTVRFGHVDVACGASGRRPAMRTSCCTFALSTLTTRPYCLWIRRWRKPRSSTSSQLYNQARILASMIWRIVSYCRLVPLRTIACVCTSSTTLPRCRLLLATHINKGGRVQGLQPASWLLHFSVH